MMVELVVIIALAVCLGLVGGVLKRTQDRLHSAERACRSIQRNAGITAFEWDFPLEQLWVHQDSLRRLCETGTAAGSKPKIALFAEEEADQKLRFLEQLSHRANLGSHLNFSFTCRGTELEIKADIIRNKLDQPARLQGVIRPKQLALLPDESSSDLKSLRARLELILETVGVGIYGLDKDGNTTFANNATCQLTGYTKSQILGRHQHEMIHHSRPDGSKYPAEECSIYKSIQSGVVQHHSNEVFWRKDGSYFPVEYQSTPVRVDGQVQGAVVVFADITERKAQEQQLEQALVKNQQLQEQLRLENEQLKETSRKLTLILESTSDGVYGLDNHGITTFANRATKTLTGWVPEDLVGLINHDVVHHSHADGSRYPKEECPIYKAFQDGKCHQGDDEVFWRKDGSSFPVEYRSSPIIEGDVPIGSVVIYRDISERKKAEEQLRLAYEEIERLNENLVAENYYLRDEIKTEYNFEEIIGESEVLKKALVKVEQVAPTDSNVLILGESGTGKELIARAVTNLSARKDKPFMKLNCAAIQKSLIENELFGHVKGAYTGADSYKAGRFECAHEGTLFLDEVGELDIEVQAKLLRVLQEGEVERLGSNEPINVDVRIIAATNRDLEEEVAAGRFREDLFYRLNIFPITLPPLRERPGDISLLVNHLVNKFNQKLDKNIKSVSQGLLKKLKKYPWPGNIRELQNVIERAVILSPGDELRISDPLDSVGYQTTSAKQSTRLEDVERSHIFKVLRQVDWKIEGVGCAAELLDINPSTLRSRMKKLKIAKTG